VGELAHGFEANSFRPLPSPDLAGRTLRLHLSDGQVIEHRFISERSLERIAVSGPAAGRSANEDYLALEIRDGLYFVDFVKGAEPATCVSLVLDLARQVCTQLTGRLPDEAEAGRSLRTRLGSGNLELTGVHAAFLGGAIDRNFDASVASHAPTSELVGKRVEYTYSPSESYEHVYLNENFYTWHCLLGVEQGLADTDRCHYRKLGDQLYLFVWREKLVPTLGVLVLDYESWTSRGKIFGYEGDDFSRVTNFTVGAKARLVNVVDRQGADAAAVGPNIAAGGAQ
jgi:hypothetical protein